MKSVRTVNLIRTQITSINHATTNIVRRNGKDMEGYNVYPTTIDGAEELLYEDHENVGEGFTIATSCGEDSKIFIDPAFIRIPSLKLDVYEGDFCNYNAEEDCWDADFSTYVFYEEGDRETPLYDENSSLAVCISNYLNGLVLTMAEIYALDCEVHIPQGIPY